jgi:hypothetical protein
MKDPMYAEIGKKKFPFVAIEEIKQESVVVHCFPCQCGIHLVYPHGTSVPFRRLPLCKFLLSTDPRSGRGSVRAVHLCDASFDNEAKLAAMLVQAGPVHYRLASCLLRTETNAGICITVSQSKDPRDIIATTQISLTSIARLNRMSLGPHLKRMVNLLQNEYGALRLLVFNTNKGIEIPAGNRLLGETSSGLVRRILQEQTGIESSFLDICAFKGKLSLDPCCDYHVFHWN